MARIAEAVIVAHILHKRSNLCGLTMVKNLGPFKYSWRYSNYFPLGG